MGVPQEDVVVHCDDDGRCRPYSTERAQNNHGSGNLDWTVDIRSM